ncbi:MAG: preprotein translocase subunit YajC [Actinomycetota bacterium]|nr:preprotein translocase subunit YajC [Actinomycetota bacterium]
MVFLVLVGAVFYFMLYRPNKRRIDQHRRLIESIEEGDEIVTIGGLFGSVRTIDDEHFHVEIAPGTTIRMAKSAVARRLEPETLEEEDDEVAPAGDPGT